MRAKPDIGGLQGAGVTAHGLHPGVIAARLLQTVFGNMKVGSVEMAGIIPHE